MASNSSTINSKILENELACSLCSDLYDDPRIFSCSHTFRYKDIRDLCQNGTGQCPMRDGGTISSRTTDQLPINRTAKNIIECINRSSSSSLPSTCQHCKQYPSQFLCKKCSRTYCTGCLKVQHNIQQLQTHEINIVFHENQNKFCSEHPEDNLKYWCNECLVFKHRSHSFTTFQGRKEKIKTQLHLSTEQLDIIQQNTDIFHCKAIEVHQKKDQMQEYIERTFNHLQKVLEQRKQDLMKMNDQQIIGENQSYIDESLKCVLTQKFLAQELLLYENVLQLVHMTENVLNNNQLIHQAYEYLIKSSTLNFLPPDLQETLSKLQLQIEQLDQNITKINLTNSHKIHSLLNLSESDGIQMYQTLDGLYAYGYRFDLSKPFELHSVRLNIALFNCQLIVFILDHKDILRKKEMFINHSTQLTWIVVPIKYRIKQNHSIFIWTQSTVTETSFIDYKNSNQRLRQTSEHISVRSKRAKITRSSNFDIGTKINVLYDALLLNDDQQTETIPAIEMILDIEV